MLQKIAGNLISMDIKVVNQILTLIYIIENNEKTIELRIVPFELNFTAVGKSAGRSFPGCLGIDHD